MRIPLPGVYDRTTRGTYGIGILKTTDGGQSWEKSLDWGYTDLRGIQDIVINPLNPNTVLAATSDGLYRSTDAGKNWENIHDWDMAVQVDYHPEDTNKIYVTYGSLNDENLSGMYRSTDNGNTFEELLNGFPSKYSGKARFAFAPDKPDLIIASVGEAFQTNGLYRSLDAGDSWELINTDDVVKWQGWYSHDVAIHPTNDEIVIWTGVDAYRSNNGGEVFFQVSVWSNWFFGQTEVGGIEGEPDYVHADIHAVYFPSKLKKIPFILPQTEVFFEQKRFLRILRA